LITVDRTAKEFEYVVYDAEDDDFQKVYSNQLDVTIAWTGLTSQVTLDTEEAAESTNEFSSDIAADVFETTKTYTATDFKFHSGS
jgi:hypothetical protein